MFDITIDGNTLYHPNSVDYNIISGVIHEELNDSGYMELTIPYSNPAYDSIVERKSKIIVFKDNSELWYGEVRDVSKDFSKNKSLYIVGEASFLNDTVQPQRKLTGTKFQVLEEMLNYHNSMIEAEKHFQIGVIDKGATDNIEIVTDWEYTLDAIRTHLCGVEEYFRIRHVNGVRYLDIMPLETYGKYSEQAIMFGENLLDYTEESTGADIATICIPLGAKLEEEGIEGYQNYLTCESVNGGKNYVELPSAIARLGHITKVVKFEDITDPNVLLTEAVNYLKTAQYATLTLNLTAIDLSILHSDIDNYAVGDYVPAICEPLGMNALFPVRERETDIVNIENNTIKIGASGTKTVTQQSAESIKELEHKMPNRDDILTAALKNASALINANGDNGNVSIRLNSDGKPYEIVIMDADTIENSTRAWRWNLSGFGHGTKNAGDPDFTWKANVAITMDGGIVADSITSGTMQADRIHGGKLKLGGYDNQDGVLEVYSIEASKYKIEFDPNCNWENNFDGVTIFYENKGKYYSSPQKLQATQVTQGIVVPEAEKIYIYWYTDNSANDFYGLKVRRVVKTDETPTLTFSIVDSLPMSETTSKIVNNGEYFDFETEHNPYLNGDRQLLGITVRGDAGKLAARLDKNGLNVFSGDIKGSDITLGGYENAQGTIDVKDSNNQSVGTWNKDGIKVFNNDKEWLELSKGFLSGGASNGEEIGKIGFVGNYDYADRDIMTLYTKGKILLSSYGFILNGPNLNWAESLVGDNGFNVISSINFDYGYIDGVQVITGAHVEYLSVGIFNGIITDISTWS